MAGKSPAHEHTGMKNSCLVLPSTRFIINNRDGREEKKRGWGEKEIATHILQMSFKNEKQENERIQYANLPVM